MTTTTKLVKYNKVKLCKCNEDSQTLLLDEDEDKARVSARKWWKIKAL